MVKQGGDEKSDRKLGYGDVGVKEQLIMLYGTSCFYCGHSFSTSMEGWSHMCIDHLVPQSKADENMDVHDFVNLRLCCRECNSAKGGKILSFEEIAAFSLRRRLKRDRDEQWVRWKYMLLEKARRFDNPEKIWTREWQKELGEELVGEFKENVLMCDYEASVYERATKNATIEIKKKSGDKAWYFQVNTYQLQPFFLYNSDGGLGNSRSSVDAYEMIGYFKDELRSKYIEPFVDAKEGVRIINREIELFESIESGKKAN